MRERISRANRAIDAIARARIGRGANRPLDEK
jgi:hypothetical protein